MSENCIELESVRGSGGARYRVWWRGRVLLERSRDPEHEAARALPAMGVTGSLAIYWRGSSHPAMHLDIETAADLTVKEGQSRPRLTAWQPFPVGQQLTRRQTCPVARHSAKRDGAGVLAEI